jgi:MtrB/PioB family decaheme-associated outer membrane protein
MAHNHRPPLALRALVVALHGVLALFASVAYAQSPAAPAGQAPSGPSFDDPAVQELVRPVNTIEAGVIGVDSPSGKFGEYNGLHREGVRPLLDFDVRGGGAYQPESGSTHRWRVYGSQLGLPVRSFGGEFAEQGSWSVGFEYDELQRIFADDYVTLWRGAGTSTLVLPPGYPAASTRTATFNNIQNAAPAAAIRAGLTGHTLQTQRRRLGLAGDLILSPQWSVGVGARHEKKDGTKLTGIAFGGFRGAYLPEPIDYETTIVETSLRYRRGNTAHLTLGYNVSLFTNRTDAWSAENPFANNATFNNRVVMAGAPDNSMHQLTADGGWRFTPATKLSVSAAYAKMKQNEDFRFQQHPGQIVNNGATRVDAEQVQQNFLARLNHAVSRSFDVTGLFRYEHRDTRTPIGLYAFAAADPTAVPPLAANRVVNNLPQNRRQQTFAVDGRYDLRQGSTFTGGVEHQRIHRSVDAPTVSLATQEQPFLSGEATQNTVRLGYRHAFTEGLNGHVSLSRSEREAGPYFDFPRTAATPAPGIFPQVPGFRQFFLASRDQNKVRASVDYQATEALWVQGTVEHLQDRYPDSRYGLNRAGMTTWTLDGVYAASDRLSFNGFVSFEDGETRANEYQLASGTAALPYAINPNCAVTAAAGSSSNIADPCREWSFTQGDRVWTLGAGAKSAHMGGKLTLTGDVVHARAKTNIDFTGGARNATTRVFVPALNMPEITSIMTDLRLGAKYDFTKESAVRLGYLFRRLRSSDPQFDLFGITSVQAYIGPGMRAPDYNVHAISVSYVYTFR